MGFGRENPSKARLRRKEEEKILESQNKEKTSEEAREERRSKRASQRDVDAKDEGRSWLAKIGLVG